VNLLISKEQLSVETEAFLIFFNIFLKFYSREADKH